MGNVFFTADTHFHHGNIIKYCDRPFSTHQEMTEKLIENWNTRIKPGDTVYHLGDFGFAPADILEQTLQRLNGQKFLVFGNHDKEIRRSAKLRAHFVKCSELLEIYVNNKQPVTLCHYAMLVWNKSHHGAWMLHGHSHGSLTYPYQAKIMDVGVDANNYYPWSVAEITHKMSAISGTVIDHHGR